MMMSDKRGFTLVELIMFILVGAIFLPTSIMAFTSALSHYSRPDYYVKARFYAEKRMSEITIVPYDNIIPGTCADTSEESAAYIINCSVTAVDDALAPTGSTLGTAPYKLVLVRVNHTGLISGYHEMRTIISRRPKKP